ncbi:hypothetical protein AVEN_64333-1 [Araneus ventricosus]|uniref:Uncharacterized protein n=1 Tax=Araneus ventricosus TaxID=182803 RepID=A0A4Y2DAK3_ARAVE|nr:hypothetical protein AVEN_64333-1 [Araneus ventricosus]
MCQSPCPYGEGCLFFIFGRLVVDLPSITFQSNVENHWLQFKASGKCHPSGVPSSTSIVLHFGIFGNSFRASAQCLYARLFRCWRPSTLLRAEYLHLDSITQSTGWKVSSDILRALRRKALLSLLTRWLLPATSFLLASAVYHSSPYKTGSDCLRIGLLERSRWSQGRQLIRRYSLEPPADPRRGRDQLTGFHTIIP